MGTKRINNYEGMQIGDWFVDKKTEEKTKTGISKYKVHCVSCNKSKTVTIQTLKSRPYCCSTTEENISSKKSEEKYIIELNILYKAKLQTENTFVAGLGAYNVPSFSLKKTKPFLLVDTSILQDIPSKYQYLSTIEVSYEKLIQYAFEPVEISSLSIQTILTEYLCKQNPDKANMLFYLEMANAESVPIEVPVVYTYYDNLDNPLYVGKSKNFLSRHFSHQQSDKEYIDKTTKIGLRFYASYLEMEIAEAYWIGVLKPPYNKEYCHQNNELFYIELFDHTEEMFFTLEDFYDNIVL